jgi:hypothetical protein
MAKRISPANVGKTFLLRFNKTRSMNGGRDPMEMENVLVKVDVVDGEARATFRDNEIGEWEAYRFKGRWSYGSSAEPLTVVE